MNLEAVIENAVAERLLPAGSTAPQQDVRPWPVVLLTALGAWLAAIPLLGVVGTLFGGLLDNSGGLYLVGVLCLCLAVFVLRSRDASLFIEQLAVPVLLVGGCALGFGLSQDLKAPTAAAVMTVVCIGLAVLLPHPWLRVLLGATAAQLLTLAGMPTRRSGALFVNFWFFVWHVNLALWLLAGMVQCTWLHDGSRTRAAAALESWAAGWLLATLLGLAWWSGMTFLLGGALGDGFTGEAARGLGQIAPSPADPLALPVVSTTLAVAAAWWAARRWATLRRPWLAGVALAVLGLAWFMPALGAALLALACCVTTGRRRLAVAAALTVAWIVGAFYDQLNWPLADKALVLVGVGGVLGALAWLALRTESKVSPPRTVLPRQTTRWSAAAIGFSALAAVALVNASIWQKEALIADGKPVYVELAPVDPRSLLQGDFMALRFNLPAELARRIDGLLTSQRPHVVASQDARGVLTVLRVDKGAPLAVNELRIELTPKNGHWILVTDAWFVKEGEAERYAAAKYGEFRVDASGRALLVGLRDAKRTSL